MKSLERIKQASVKEILQFMEQHMSVSDLLTEAEAIELQEASNTVKRLNDRAIKLTEAMVAKVRDAVNESEYNGSFEEEHGYEEDDANDLVSDFGGSIAYEMGMDFDGRELWESSSC